MHSKVRVAPWPSIEMPETFPALEARNAIDQLLNALDALDALDALNSLNDLNALNSLQTKRGIGNSA